MADSRAKPYTKAGADYIQALTEWLQDTRLMSEAVFRLYKDYDESGRVNFSGSSWPKPPKRPDVPLRTFSIDPVPLGQRMHELLRNLWTTRFVFLETLWEEYLQELVKELRHEDTSIFEPFCQKEFMAEVVRNVLIDRLDSVDEIKTEMASRFAEGITRTPWDQQWKQLTRLKVGLSEKDEGEPWFPHLDIYFEVRNCIVHRQGRVSPLLARKDPYYEEKGLDRVEIWPPQLDFYRGKFIECLMHIETKIRGWSQAKKTLK